MKNIIILLILFIGCSPEPEFYINGKPYYTRQRCIESKTETKWEYHYAFDCLNGEYKYMYGPKTYTCCIKSTVDTIEIKTTK
jgi:hypothetical protein